MITRFSQLVSPLRMELAEPILAEYDILKQWQWLKAVRLQQNKPKVISSSEILAEALRIKSTYNLFHTIPIDELAKLSLTDLLIARHKHRLLCKEGLRFLKGRLDSEI
jgi:hypothetical protein